MDRQIVGTAYQFECRACGYNAHVCGGRDSGMDVVVLTSVCGDRRELVDVPVGRSREKDVPATANDEAKMGCCPKCGGGNLDAWPRSHACPKCGARMRKGNVVSYWD